MFTRLTPLQQSRNANNLYPVEVAFNSQQQSLRWETIQPYVIANGEPYPLRPVPLVQNRWEGFVPVPPGANSINYRFKFDYKYNNLGTAPKPSSRSEEHTSELQSLRHLVCRLLLEKKNSIPARNSVASSISPDTRTDPEWYAG